MQNPPFHPQNPPPLPPSREQAQRLMAHVGQLQELDEEISRYRQLIEALERRRKLVVTVGSQVSEKN